MMRQQWQLKRRNQVLQPNRLESLWRQARLRVRLQAWAANEARANLSPKDWQARLRLQGFPAVAKYLQAANASRHNT